MQMDRAEVLEGLVSTSKWPRNEAKFLASSRPRPRKTRIKSLVLKMAEKKAEIPRNSSSRPRKGRGKVKKSSPHLVLDLGKTREFVGEFLQGSRPRTRPLSEDETEVEV